jgi:hypothetical protein
MGWVTDESWFDSWWKQNTYHYFEVSRQVLITTQPSIQWVGGALPTRVNRPVRETNHLSRCYAVVNSMWSHGSFPFIRLHGMHRSSFTLKLHAIIQSSNRGAQYYLKHGQILN